VERHERRDRAAGPPVGEPEPEGGQESRRGERPGRRLKANFLARFGPRRKASKSKRLFVAAGSPVSGQSPTARGQRPVMSRDGFGSGETPGRKPWTWLRDATSPHSRRRSKPSRGCENLRAERTGRGMLPGPVDAAGDAAKRAETLAGRVGRKARQGGTAKELRRRDEARENEPASKDAADGRG
jgi:hypothetical protein